MEILARSAPCCRVVCLPGSSPPGPSSLRVGFCSLPAQEAGPALRGPPIWMLLVVSPWCCSVCFPVPSISCKFIAGPGGFIPFRFNLF